MALEDQLRALLATHPGLKGRELAEKLGLEKRLVNSCLARHRGVLFVQDSRYRWRLVEAGEERIPVPDARTEAESQLATLCRYYLECLSHDRELDISVFANGQFGVNYVELKTLPFGLDGVNLFEQESARRLLNEVRHDRNRLTLYLGYPIRLRHLTGRNGWEGFKLEPVCVWTYQDQPDAPGALPELSDIVPSFNYSVLKNFSRTTGTFLEEMVLLAEELGIVENDEAPELDELFSRLRAIRPDWNWVEDPNVDCLSSSPGLSEIRREGIFNRGVLLTGDRSPYTRGLEAELKKLTQVSESEYGDTALGSWISGRIGEVENRGDALIEILPLNTEQRAAVQQGINQRLTVITGPPGTGKSQVVTSLLLNAAWRGKKVLFASKNNRAVDVVEVRCNNLGPRPILLRVGKNEFQSRLAEYLDGLLAATSTSEDRNRFEEAQERHKSLMAAVQRLEETANSTVQQRNRVDKLEQQVEEHRILLGSQRFAVLRSFDNSTNAAAAERILAAVQRAERPDRGLRWLWWRLTRTKRLKILQDALENGAAMLSQLGMRAPAVYMHEVAEDLRAFCIQLTDRLKAAQEIQDYFRSLAELDSAEPLEKIAASQARLTQEISTNSRKLWQHWLRLQPSRLSAAQRHQLSRYAALLRMILGGGQQVGNLDGGVFAEYYRLFQQISSALNCWAVTSLSAQRVPFEAGFFDLVIIDESSQCDIASALPLLFRAKSAVIIGDPRQLRHISNLSDRKDRQLAAQFSLIGTRENWAYATNSVFDLARSVCGPTDIISLRDHHRSHADIIGFSNREFYEERLRVATRYDQLKRPAGPAVRWLNVRGHVIRPASGGALNAEEARAIVRELRRLVLEQGYSGSIGVVAPFRAQANYIKDLVTRESDLHQQLVRRNFIASTVHEFQGDERDVIIFSPVVATGITNSAIKFLQNNGNLFNVAITRARAALVVIGDSDTALHSDVGYLERFAAYATANGNRGGEEPISEPVLGPVYPPVSRPELVSPWEHVLYTALYSAGVRAIPQYNVEQYILDFAVVCGAQRLAIEVDGERYHRNWDGELCRRDQIRNQRLFELGWDVMRFWVYQVRDEPEVCVSRVTAWIAKAQKHAVGGM